MIEEECIGPSLRLMTIYGDDKNQHDKIWFTPNLASSILPLFAPAGMNFLRCRLLGLRRTASIPRPSGQIGASRNQARTTFVGDIRPRPLNEDEDAVAESDQEKNVNE